MNQYDVAGELKTYAERAAKAQTTEDLKDIIRKVREAFDLRKIQVEKEDEEE